MSNEPQLDTIEAPPVTSERVEAVESTTTATIAVPTEVVEAAAMMREQAVSTLTKPVGQKESINLHEFKEEMSLEAASLFRDAAHREMLESVIGALLVMYKKTTALDLQLGMKAIRSLVADLHKFLSGCDDVEYARRAAFVAEKAENGGRLEKYLNMSSRNGFRSADQIIYNMKRDIETYLNPPKEPERVVVESKPLTEGQKTLKQLRFEVAALKRKLEVLNEQSPTISSVREKLSKKEQELARLEGKEPVPSPTAAPQGPDQPPATVTA